jgi:hypothetical protein
MATVTVSISVLHWAVQRAHLHDEAIAARFPSTQPNAITTNSSVSKKACCPRNA